VKRTIKSRITQLKHPNENFYQNESLFRKSQFILFRHAEALHNVFYKQLKKDLSHLSPKEFKIEKEKARFSRKLLDAHLTENGIK